jgi:hypothetical protein
MSAKVNFKESDQKLIIEIIPKHKAIIKIGFIFFFIMPIFLVFGLMVYRRISNNDYYIEFELDTLYIVSLFILVFIIIRNILRRLYQKELIIIDNKTMTIIKKLFFFSKKRVFPFKNVKDIKSADKDEFTRHPLEPEGFDYLGAGTSEREMDFIIESGRIRVFYNGSVFRFGKGLLEEDRNEIIRRINKRKGL